MNILQLLPREFKDLGGMVEAIAWHRGYVDGLKAARRDTEMALEKRTRELCLTLAVAEESFRKAAEVHGKPKKRKPKIARKSNATD